MTFCQNEALRSQARRSVHEEWNHRRKDHDARQEAKRVRTASLAFLANEMGTASIITGYNLMAVGTPSSIPAQK